MAFDHPTLMRSIGPNLVLTVALAIAGCTASPPRNEIPPSPAVQAAPEPAPSAVTAPPAASASGLDPVRFCYYEGQAYSPGATRDGLVCGEPEGLSVYSANRQPKPLQWLPVQP